MRRVLASLMIAVVAWLGVPAARCLAHQTKAGIASDAKEIYAAFLTEWLGKDDAPVNVANTAVQPTQQDIAQYNECVSGVDTHWTAGSSDEDLKSALSSLPRINKVDPKHWRAMDPGRLIAKGQSVDAAVRAGITNGLMTLSAISFNDAHDTAMLNFSFVCGGLCGNGGTVMFKKTPKGWVRSEQRCNSWMS